MKKVDYTKPKDSVRVGFETMEWINDDSKHGTYRYYFKGRVAIFDVINRAKSEDFEGTLGWILTLLRRNGAIFYDAFERYDGVVWFLGESESQVVDKSQRNREAAYLNRFS